MQMKEFIYICKIVYNSYIYLYELFHEALILQIIKWELVSKIRNKTAEVKHVSGFFQTSPYNVKFN